MRNRTKTDLIVIHCSATKPSQDVGVKEIDEWHRKPPNKWIMIGYHFVIRRNGIIETGRPLMAVGAGVYPPAGVNSRAVHICMVGGVKESDGKTPENNFTREQWIALDSLVDQMLEKFPGSDVDGHGNISKDRACPSFNVKEWIKNRKTPVPGKLVDTKSEVKIKPVVNRPVLYPGDKGEAVKELQKFLKFTGSDVDGVFGPKTLTAVKAFQKANGLLVDGIVGPKTWEKLCA